MGPVACRDCRSCQAIPAYVSISCPEIPIPAAIIIDDVAMGNWTCHVIAARYRGSEAASAVGIGPHREGEAVGIEIGAEGNRNGGIRSVKLCRRAGMGRRAVCTVDD